MNAPAPALDPLRLRTEALLMLEGRGTILETARDVSGWMRAAGLPGVVVGGVAVVLHGYVRTTRDVGVFLEGDAAPFHDLLAAHGFAFDPERRQFQRAGVPVHLVRPEQLGMPLRAPVEIEGVTVPELADLLAIKLRSGQENLLRAKDLADVIGLIRHHRLGPTYAARLPREVRPTFRKLARAIEREG